MFNVVAAVAAMERELLIERSVSGLKAARARGRKGGRRPTYGVKEARRVAELYEEGNLTMAEIARAVGVSVTTAYRLLDGDARGSRRERRDVVGSASG